MGTTVRSKRSGVVVSALAVAATTAVIYPLRQHMAVVSTGVLLKIWWHCFGGWVSAS
jgi:hypothetical protein